MESGDRVHMVPVDPWDLVTAIGSGPFAGSVIAVDESNHEAILLKLDTSLTYGELTVELFKAYTRHFGEKFAAEGVIVTV